ncbi:genetic suppressor element 1 isoform X1 [Astyanax mexicanus]|uniref:Genetic suppressor element 1 isoform X1 n=1 Tax=Astyanax mexicanus TaxID=7994 RepID=A0A8T2LLB8_ASTMX|nr:genetic suppressor element 1 isoform X1 [Astyanax mexicanus]
MTELRPELHAAALGVSAATARKQRLMGAEERAPPPLVHCFVCGSGVTPGKELRLPVSARGREGGPCFPFLQGQEPAPGARDVGPDGHALACAVCHCFLREQWNAFERTRTPLDKRVYWLKRPHQCDSRRLSRDWGAARDPDAAGGLGGGDGSESSSLSESENEQDLEDGVCSVSARAHASMDGVGKFGPRNRSGTVLMNHDGHASHSTGTSSSVNSISKQLLFDADVDDATVASSGRVVAADIISTEVSMASEEEEHRGGRGHRCSCYVCGRRLPPGARFEVSVQKQERATGEPFFPFLWLHTPPPGAMPLSPRGRTLVCASCHSSLLQQWQAFELADVPVLQRLYVVPLDTGNADPLSPTLGTVDGAGSERNISKIRPVAHPIVPMTPPRPTREACYLCGRDCGRDIRVAYARAGVGKARGAMYFPFINMLPCPPDAQGIRDGQVHCCTTCHSILEDIWAAYRLCLSEELITSVSTFLGRYHQATGGGGVQASPGGSVRITAATTAGHTSICYLCGAELSPHTEYQLRVNPPGRCADREPFFPFLTVHPPAPRARPADATGLVSACALCYHDLLGQWAQHEGSGPGQGPSSSPWSRQYSCDSFVCFFCRREKRRPLGLRAVTVARLPVFLYAPRVGRTLVVDDGKQLTIGSCGECKAMVLAGQNLKQDGGVDRGVAAGKQKSSTVEVFAGSKKEEDVGQRTGALKEVSRHDHSQSAKVAVISTSSQSCTEQEDQSPSSESNNSI